MNTQQTIRENLEGHLPRIRKIVGRIARDRGLVDDLTQECCVRIIEKEHLWKQERGTMAKWINAITRNLTLDQQRKKQETVSLDDLEIAETPTEEVFSEEHIGWVLKKFGELPDGQRQVLQMRYFEQMKVVDIAESLGVSQPAVSQQIQTSLKTLKKQARAEGLLAFLLPWNWDLEKIYQGVIMNSQFKTAAMVVGTLAIGATTTHIIHSSTIDDLNSKLTLAITDNDKLSTKLTDLEDKLSDRDAEFEKWTQKLDSLEQEKIALQADLKKSSDDLASANAKVAKIKLPAVQPDPVVSNNSVDIEEDKKPENPLASMMNAEFLKSVVPMQIEPVVVELRQVLSLTKDQEAKLKELLTAKAETDIDALSPIFDMMKDGGMKDIEKMIELQKENPDELTDEQMAFKDKMDGIQESMMTTMEESQSTFEQEANKLLSPVQIDKFIEFEKKKAKEQTDMTVNMQMMQLQSVIPDLMEDQKEQIKKVYEDTYSNKGEVKIGMSSGGMFGGSMVNMNLKASKGSKKSSKKNMDERIKSVLTPEQQEGYQKHLDQQVALAKGAMGMFGGAGK